MTTKETMIYLGGTSMAVNSLLAFIMLNKERRFYKKAYLLDEEYIKRMEKEKEENSK